MGKQIVLIGCRTEGILQKSLAIYHTVPSDIGKDELQALVMEFQAKEFEVLVVGTELDITKEQQPEPFRPEPLRLELTMPKPLDPYFHVSIKDLEKSPVYPKSNYKRKLRKNRKR